MTLHVNDAGSWRTISNVYVNDNGTWRLIQDIYVNDAGTWRLVYSALAVTASDILGLDSGFATSGTVDSTGQLANPVITGGTGPYTYSWAHVSTSSGNTPSIFSGTTANPVWSATVADAVNSISIWRVTVTDTSSGATATDDIQVELDWQDLT